jgi:PAS domain S-box-containing protein
MMESAIGRQREQLAILGRDARLTSLASITAIVGFEQLKSVALDGTITTLAGTDPRRVVPDALLRSYSNSAHAFFQPIVSDAGWTSYLVGAPQFDAEGHVTGTLIAAFDPSALLERVLSTEYVGQTAQVVLALKNGDDITVLHSTGDTSATVPVHLSGTERTAILREALAGKEGVADTTDYSGINVIAAYRAMPSIGWALVVQMDRYELTSVILHLASTLFGVGLMLITLLSLSVFFLARRIVGPLEELAVKLNGLEARHWRFAPTIFTGNELETVDRAADELTTRLRKAHDHLEEMVKERTQELQTQLAEDTAILASIDYGLIVTDVSGGVQFINRAGELLTGYSFADAKGMDIHDALPVLDRTGFVIDPAEHPVQTVLTTKMRYHPDSDPELSLKRPDKTITALYIRVTPIMKGKQCLGAVAVFRDITEERRIDHMKSDFISLVSHQLRTPLSSMRWYLEMLLGKDAGPLTADQQEYIEEVATSNSRMVHLVNALLNVSRLELGSVQLSPETIDLVKLTNEVGDSFKLELQRRKMSLNITPTERATIEARSDKGLVQMMIENLLSNAIKYGNEGTAVTVELATDREKGNVAIAISDTGIGIPEAQQESIGKKLFRGTNARLSDADGNGLGLYISHIAAETIGAKLTFTSKEGKGTTFTVTLPLAPATKEEAKKVL